MVQGGSYEAVMIIGPSHYADFPCAAIGDWDSVRTPLGGVAVDVSLVRALDEASELVSVIPGVDAEEHSVEVQIPFLQMVLPGVPVVPVLVRDLSFRQAEALARSLTIAVGRRKVLLVASSDMSHFPSYKDACEVDAKVLDAVRVYDARKVISLNRDLPARGIPGLGCALCGAGALATVMLASHDLGADQAFMLPYANSGDTGGDRDRVVGYGAAAFLKSITQHGGSNVETIGFTPEEKGKLFRIARESILAALAGGLPKPYDVTEQNLILKRGVFVTLTNRGRLRGCIGHFGQDIPLHEIVSQMAVAAATQDYRFLDNPVTKTEMKDIRIKISILSPLRKIESVDEIEIGKHGIWVRQGMHSGTYLPEVAEEMGWTRTEFLEHCCVEKAGLPPDAWKRGADIYVYSSEILSED